MRPVAIGWRFVQLVTGRQVPAEWMRALEDRRLRLEGARRDRVARLERAARYRREAVQS